MTSWLMWSHWKVICSFCHMHNVIYKSFFLESSVGLTAMDPASRATASEAWNLVSMLPYIHSSHSNLVVILSCFKSTLREMQWDLLVIASLWMKLLLFQVYMMLMLFCFWGFFLFTQRDCQSWPAMEWCWLQTGWQGLRGGQGHKVSVAAAAAAGFS